MKTRLAALALLLVAGTAVAQRVALPLFVVHFETGPRWNASVPPGDQPTFAEHSANLNRLRNERAIAFGARYGEFGMIVVRAASQDAAKAMVDADPGVRSGIFTYRIDPLSVFYPWQE